MQRCLQCTDGLNRFPVTKERGFDIRRYLDDVVVEITYQISQSSQCLLCWLFLCPRKKPGDPSTPTTIRRVVGRAIPLVFCSFLPLAAASSFSFSLRVDLPAHRPKWLLKLLPRCSIGCSDAFFQRHFSFHCPVGSPIRSDRGFLSRSIESRVQSSSHRLTGQKNWNW